MELPSTAPAVAETPLKGEVSATEPSRAQRAIARRSAETRATVPDLELAVDVDAGALLELTERQGFTTTGVLVSACAAALREFPVANSAYRDGRYEGHSRVNIAVVLETDDAQTAATILDADTKSPARLDEELAHLRRRARAGELTAPEQAGATFTVSDLGEFGIDRGAALVVPPQAAALTAGAIRPVPVVRDGAVVPGHRLALTLTCDHRILFGALAARFLARVAKLLEAAG